MLKASAEDNADLFWALRGGGGNFGVVTSLEYRVHPVGPVLGGELIPAHWHPWIEHATVISGTLRMGIGDKLDRSQTKQLPAGSVAVIQPKTNHFSWTKEETIVQVHGMGPLVIHYVNPADDPRRK